MHIWPRVANAVPVSTLAAAVLLLTSTSGVLSPAQAAEGAPSGVVEENVANEDLVFQEDEYCFGSTRWEMCHFDQHGASTFARVWRDGSRAANGDGSLRLATRKEDDLLALDKQPHAPAPLDELSRENLSFSLRVVRGDGPTFSLSVDCAPDEQGGGMSMRYADSMPSAGEGWQTVDLVQGGDAVWTVSSSEQRTTFREVRTGCPDGEVSRYGFSFGYGRPAGKSVSRLDDVRVGQSWTNFWVAPLTRAAGTPFVRTATTGARAQDLAEMFFARPGRAPDSYADPTRLRRPVARGAVIAPQGDRPTTLVAGPLARAVRGPLLFNSRSELDASSSNTLRLVPADAPVYLVGNPRQLSRKVARQLRRDGRRVVRLGGPTRYVTAVKVARAIDRRRPDRVRRTVLLASVRQQLRTLSASAAAGSRRGAVLLTKGKRLPPATRRYLANHSRTRVFAVGGQASAAVDLPRRREITGPHRYALAVKVAEKFFHRPRTAVFAAGRRPADALLAGAYGGLRRGPMLLVRKDSIPAGVRRYIRDHRGRMRSSVLVADQRAVTRKVFKRLRRRLPAG